MITILPHPVRGGIMTNYLVALKLLEYGYFHRHELDDIFGKGVYSSLIRNGLIQQYLGGSYGITKRGHKYLSLQHHFIKVQIGKNENYLPASLATNPTILKRLKTRLDKELGFYVEKASQWRVTVEKIENDTKTMTFDAKADAMEMMVALANQQSVTKTSLDEVT